jgi:hypothetical protein
MYVYTVLAILKLVNFYTSFATLTTEYTEGQWPLSRVHSITMVKSAQPG